MCVRFVHTFMPRQPTLEKVYYVTTKRHATAAEQNPKEDRLEFYYSLLKYRFPFVEEEFFGKESKKSWFVLVE